MVNLIISSVIFSVALFLVFAFNRSLKNWRIENEEFIQELKQDMGADKLKNMNINPHGTARIRQNIALFTLGAFAYLVISALLFFFAK